MIKVSLSIRTCHRPHDWPNDPTSEYWREHALDLTEAPLPASIFSTFTMQASQQTLCNFVSDLAAVGGHPSKMLQPSAIYTPCMSLVNMAVSALLLGPRDMQGV